MGFGSDYWDRTVRADQNGWAPDLPGYGETPGPFTVPAAVDALAATARQIGGGAPIDIVGVSLGARLALVLAARHPELARSLAISGLTTDSTRAGTTLRVLLTRLLPERALTLHSPRTSKNATIATMKALPDLALREHLPRVHAPVLVWWAEQDHSSQTPSRSVAAILSARFDTVPGASHFWTREHADEFEHRYTNWISGLHV